MLETSNEDADKAQKNQISPTISGALSPKIVPQKVLTSVFGSSPKTQATLDIQRAQSMEDFDLKLKQIEESLREKIQVTENAKVMELEERMNQ